MERSRPITLFTEVPAPRRGPSGFLVSILVHLAVICLCYLYVKETVRVTDRIANQRYLVRLINVRQPPMRMMPSGGSDGGAPAPPSAVTHAADQGNQIISPIVRPVIRPAHATQTLVQPDLPPDLLATKPIPLPQVLIWSAGQTPAVKITPPHPQIANVPIAHPSLETPNEQLTIAELKISPTAFNASALTLPPSTTAPLALKRALLPVQMPAAASNLIGPATPIRVISLSDTQLQRGTIVLPTLNEVGTADGVDDPLAEKALAAGSSKGIGKQSGDGAANVGGDHGRGSAAGTGKDVASAGAGGQGAKQGSGHGDAATEGTVAGNGTGNGDAGPADEPSVTEIRQPMDGQFGAVVVGASIAERYPETMQLWAGRLAYTVYLHVGLEKNWILQYAAMRGAVSVDGNAAQPNAPWPYLMERPHLAPGDFNADAVMVHGRLNTSGHFEALAVVFPADFSQAQFVLSALRQWRFRPATQNGMAIALEVLLIIPEEE
jgi:hypothetical protein